MVTCMAKRFFSMRIFLKFIYFFNSIQEIYPTPVLQHHPCTQKPYIFNLQKGLQRKKRQKYFNCYSSNNICQNYQKYQYADFLNCGNVLCYSLEHPQGVWIVWI